jgi:membrane protein DedA with SNARE-associated domain
MSDWIVRLIEQSGYLGIGFLMFLETVFPPIPSEVIMSIAGVAAGQGKLGYALVVAAGTAGAMLGNVLWYLAARALGVERLRPFIRKHGRWLTITWPEVQRAQHWFGLHGWYFVLLGRLIPTIRSLVSIPAGLLKMRFRTFFIASTIGTAGWTAFLAGVGYKLGEHAGRVNDVIGPIANAILVLLVAIYVWRLITHKGDPESEAGR